MTRIRVFFVVFFSFCVFHSLNAQPNDFQKYGEFESKNLKYEYLQPKHREGLLDMFSGLDLLVLMNKPGLTAEILTEQMVTLADKIQQLGKSGEFDITGNNLILYGISQREDSEKFKAGDFIGSASLQKLSREAIANKNEAFANLEKSYGNLYMVGLSFRKEAQGLGYAREVCQTFTKHFFDMSLGIPLVLVSSGFKGNVPSVRTMEGCGFTKFLEEPSASGDSFYNIVHYMKTRE